MATLLVKRVGEDVSKEISKQTYLHTKETNELTRPVKRISLKREYISKEISK